MKPDRATEAPLDFRHIRDVIEVAMREQEQFRRDLCALRASRRRHRARRTGSSLPAHRSDSNLSRKFRRRMSGKRLIMILAVRAQSEVAPVAGMEIG